MGGYDLMWNDGPVYKEDVNPETFGSLCFTANTHLGNQTGKNFFEATKSHLGRTGTNTTICVHVDMWEKPYVTH